MPCTGRGSQEPFNAVRYSTSWLLPSSVLFFLRALISLYIFSSIFTILGVDNAKDPKIARHYFSYFTSLTFWGLAFYFAFSALHTGSYWLTGTPLLARWPKVLQVIHGIYYTTITTYPFLVTIVFWSIIFDNHFVDTFDIWSNVSEHALNSAFALFEIFIPRTATTPFIHLVALIIILALYLGLAYITYADEHFYVYDFLNDHIHSHGVVAGYIFGILAATIIVFVIVHFLITLRKWVTETKMGKTGKFSNRGARVPHDAEIQMHTKESTMVDQPELVA